LNIKDKQNPFYYNKRYLLHGLDINTTPGIFLNNSYINDIKSIKGGTLVKFKDNINIDNLVDILNIIYRTENDIGN
jgi:hypothetical protein